MSVQTIRREFARSEPHLQGLPRFGSGLIKITASIVDYDVYSRTATIGACANPINLPLLTTDLLVNKFDGRTAVAPGDTLTYTIAITNLGSLSAANVIIITDTLSPYLTYVSDNTGVTATLTNSVSITSTTVDTSPVNNVYEIGVNARNGEPTALHVLSFAARTDLDRIKWLVLASLGTVLAGWIIRRRGNHQG